MLGNQRHQPCGLNASTANVTQLTYTPLNKTTYMNQEKFAEWLQSQGLNSYDEAVEQFLKQVADNFDPRDYMTPTQREIADLSLEELESEYAMVQAKTNPRSAAQRKFITQRYEYELNNAGTTTTEQDSSNA
jgi:hypothetical protein